MSSRVVDRSPDLQRLHADRYDLRITPGTLLVVSHVPYVTPARTVAYGQLVSSLELSAEATVNPVSDHSLYFIGDTPCDQQGVALERVIIQSQPQELEAGLVIQHRFSAKPADNTPFTDYHAKITSYINILMAPAQALDGGVSATRDHPVTLEDDDPTSPFMYRDNASSRAGVSVISDKLRLPRVAIVGLGGTGSYILDLIAKTPVGEIHLFDGDDLLDHNAFRSPGAVSLDELNAQPKKVDFLAARYSVMKRNVIPHPYAINERSVAELSDMDFVFLAAEGGEVKRLVLAQVEASNIPVIDVGLGVARSGDSLGGMACVTTSTPTMRDQARARMDLSDPAPDDIYEDNIQIADLNALNAVLAVIRWKKLYGFYRDQAHEHFSVYTVDGNQLDNADRECPVA